METREKILEAAERVMRSKGIAHSTTKEIAQEAGVAEGSLYNHFASKEALFLCVLHERMPNFVALAQRLPELAGQGDVRGNLTEVAEQALAFYCQAMPIAASIFSTPALLDRHRVGLQQHDAGPHKANEMLAAYLRAEQRLGRISPSADIDAATSLLLGACFQRAFLTQFLGQELAPAEIKRFAGAIVATLWQGLSPTTEV